MKLADDLYEFAYCPPAAFDHLSFIAAGEPWGEGNRILVNYIRQLYKRIAYLYGNLERKDEDGNSLFLSEENVCFDTGLFTEYYESIYALFIPNAKQDSLSEWFLKGFYKTSDPELSFASKLPDRIRFWEDARDLIYDNRLDIRVNVDHILDNPENVSRVPEVLQDPANRSWLTRTFQGAVDEVKKRVSANYTLAVPQYYNDNIQLLLPISLTRDEPELALAIQRYDGYYVGHTCLTLDWAYQNARLIVRPEASWIQSVEENRRIS
jgi:hypothetical protein